MWGAQVGFPAGLCERINQSRRKERVRLRVDDRDVDIGVAGQAPGRFEARKPAAKDEEAKRHAGSIVRTPSLGENCFFFVNWLGFLAMPLHRSEPPSLDLTIVIVNFALIAHVERLLESLEQHPPQAKFEVILIENGSPDPTEHLVRTRFPWVRYRRVENGGFAAGNNRGIEIGRGRHFLLLNPDTRVLPGQLDPWLAWAQAHPEVGLVGASLQYPNGDHQRAHFQFHRLLTPFFRRTALGKTSWGRRHLAAFESDPPPRPDGSLRVDWALAAAVIVSREAIMAVQGLDEAFFLYFEDEDLCRRLWQRGYEVAHLPSVRIEHRYGKLSRLTSWLDVFRKRAFRAHLRSAVRYFWRYRPRPLRARLQKKNPA